ncbi:hypothetical protein [Nonomuraea dietziae]
MVTPTEHHERPPHPRWPWRAPGDADAEQEYGRLLDSLSGEPAGQDDIT